MLLVRIRIEERRTKQGETVLHIFVLLVSQTLFVSLYNYTCVYISTNKQIDIQTSILCMYTHSTIPHPALSLPHPQPTPAATPTPPATPAMHPTPTLCIRLVFFRPIPIQMW